MRSLLVVFSGTFFLFLALSFLGGQLGRLPSEADMEMCPLDQASGYRIRSNQFSRNEEEGMNRLSFFWWDHADNPHTVVFSLPQQAVEDAAAEFGYFPSELNKFVEAGLEPLRTRMLGELRKHVLKLLAGSRYGHYYYIEDKGILSFNLKIMTPDSLPQQEREDVRVEFQKIVNALAKKQAPYVKKIQAEELKIKSRFLQTRGFRLEGTTLLVDYSWALRSNRERIRPAVEGLSRTAQGKSVHEFLSLLLAYVQSMSYGTPPLDEADKVILGFWPPPKVLVNNYGDCDSKGVLFASLWTHFRRYPLLLIRIPRHLFVGIAIPSFRGEQFSINGLRYTFCEVAGPELIPPGFISGTSRLYLQRGGFHYELIR